MKPLKQAQPSTQIHEPRPTSCSTGSEREHNCALIASRASQHWELDIILEGGRASGALRTAICVCGRWFRSIAITSKCPCSARNRTGSGPRSALHPGARMLTLGLITDRSWPRQEGYCHLCPRPFPAGLPPCPAAVSTSLRWNHVDDQTDHRPAAASPASSRRSSPTAMS